MEERESKRRSREGVRWLIRERIMEELQERHHMDDGELLEMIDRSIGEMGQEIFLPLKERLRDFLILHFQLRANGRKQLLKKEIQIYLPNVLAYDMKDGENCCKRADIPVPDGFEAVSGRVLKMWSDWIMENWNLYKRELHGKHSAKKHPPAPTGGTPSSGINEREMERRIREVVETYENSTSWRITRPLRALGRLFQK